jgi:hypothetical protein
LPSMPFSSTSSWVSSMSSSSSSSSSCRRPHVVVLMSSSSHLSCCCHCDADGERKVDTTDAWNQVWRRGNSWYGKWGWGALKGFR